MTNLISIPKGTRVRIVEIGELDAFFEEAETIVGRTGTVDFDSINPSGLERLEGFEYFMGVIFLDEPDGKGSEFINFAYVLVELI